MRITTKLVLDMNTGEVLEHEHFEYEGPLAMAGGGPSQQQQDAATAQAQLSNTLAGLGAERNQRDMAAYKEILPFAQSRIQNGLPFFSALTDAQGGVNARAFQPAYAQLNRQFASQPSGPSGSRDAAFRALDAAKARGFDDSMTKNLLANEAAKQGGAGLLAGQQQAANPLGFFTGASQANNSIMQAPLQSAGIGGLLGGIAGGAASAIPF